MSEAKWRQEAGGSWRIDLDDKSPIEISGTPDGGVCLRAAYGFGGKFTAEQWAAMPLRPGAGDYCALWREACDEVAALKVVVAAHKAEAAAYRRERDAAQKALADRLVGPMPTPEPDRLDELLAERDALTARAEKAERDLEQTLESAGRYSTRLSELRMTVDRLGGAKAEPDRLAALEARVVALEGKASGEPPRGSMAAEIGHVVKAAQEARDAAERATKLGTHLVNRAAREAEAADAAAPSRADVGGLKELADRVAGAMAGFKAEVDAGDWKEARQQAHEARAFLGQLDAALAGMVAP